MLLDLSNASSREVIASLFGLRMLCRCTWSGLGYVFLGLVSVTFLKV